MTKRETVFSAIAVALLLLTMASGNSYAMLVVSLLGLVISLALQGRKVFVRLVLGALFGGAVAFAVAMILKSRNH